MDDQTTSQRPLNRFNTGHYADFAAHHADVVEALGTELQVALAQLERAHGQIAELAEQVASLKKQSNEQELTIQDLRRQPDQAGRGAQRRRK